MWTSQVLTQVALSMMVSSIVPCIAQFHHNVHSELRSFHRHPKIQIIETNDALVEQFHPRRSKLDVAPPNQSRVRREVDPPKPSDKEKEDREFLRELREALRNTRATYAAVTKLMNREHASEKKKLFVKQDPIVMDYFVNSEQIEQILKSSEELAKHGTRLPLWGIPTKDFAPSETTTIDVVHELREVLRDSRATYATTVRMNREHTKAKKNLFVPQERVVMEHGVNSEQIAEIVKSSKERNPAVWPLIGMTTTNITITTGAIDFIRELREVFRNSRATYVTATKLPHHAENNSPRKQLRARKDPALAKYQVDSRQLAEIIKSSEERVNPTVFPLIGS